MNFFFILLLFIKIKNKKLWWVVSFFCDWLQRMEDKDQQENIFLVVCFLGFGRIFFGVWFGLVWFGLNKSWRDL